jgi:phage major head subunit gpT-like protein
MPVGYDLNVIERGVRGIFAREFMTRNRKAKYPKFTTIVDSDKQSEKYNAISTLPQLAEMKDERVLAGFSEYSYEVTNKPYSTGIKIPRTVFEFDQVGQLRTLVQSLSARTSNFPDKLVATLIGNNGNGYDGVSFFGASHDLGDGTTQDNAISGHLNNDDITAAGDTGADITTAIKAMVSAAQIDIINAKTTLSTFVDDRGEPWHDDVEKDGLILYCHARAEPWLRIAVEGALIENSANLGLKSVGGIVSTNRTEPFKDSGGTVRYGTFYLMKVDTPIQPLVFQRFGPKTNFPDTIPEADHASIQALNSVEIQTIMRTGRDIDAQTFFNDEFLFGARVVYGCGYGMWQNIIRVESSDWV